MQHRRYQLLVYIAALAAQAVVISLLERMIPSPFVFAPGAKLGLANLITIIALFTLPTKYSFQVVTLRLILTMLLGGTLSTFFYSVAGGYLSYFGMLLAKQLGPKRVSVIGLSIFGGILHNIGQLAVAALFAKSWSVLNYLPVLYISGLLAGAATGITGYYLLNHIKILRQYHQHFINEPGWFMTVK
ncbi:Gx transporter family protein [Dolosicoccus paucivorans]|uniref:Heptaprenyl diphosphate synthase n=1 Tax=Dolosicoccus paucivorans TaxID=84521 RepID=A0A2N6SKY2_9LACT|nr:Gx transporter family protein [Dolosicoccus paucivorans]PMB83575.1 heptaprenyl diphosphate synthase [Dolosicoccus paucivorans]PMC56704.1 heptaprenyl diphosphate synthase [Dolosicoccus paucivorans]